MLRYNCEKEWDALIHLKNYNPSGHKRNYEDQD